MLIRLPRTLRYAPIAFRFTSVVVFVFTALTVSPSTFFRSTRNSSRTMTINDQMPAVNYERVFNLRHNVYILLNTRGYYVPKKTP